MNNQIPLRDFADNSVPPELMMAKEVMRTISPINPYAEMNGSTPVSTDPAFDQAIRNASKAPMSFQQPLYEFSLAENIRYQGDQKFTRTKTKDELEKIYANEQGWSGRLGRRLRESYDNFTFANWGNYSSTGALISTGQEELSKKYSFGQVALPALTTVGAMTGLPIGNAASLFGYGAKEGATDLYNVANEGVPSMMTAISQANITDEVADKAFRDRLNEVNDPLYSSYKEGESIPWYSLEGSWGQALGSSGYSASSWFTAGLNFAGAQAARAAAASGVGLIGLGALYGLGIPIMTNNQVRDFIGEKNADAYIGFLTQVGVTALAGGKINPGAKSIQEATKGLLSKNASSASIFKEMFNPQNFTADALMKGGAAQASKAFTTIKGLATNLKNTRKLTQFGTQLTLGYFGSGNEAALQGVNAQMDYLDEEYDRFIADNGKTPTVSDLNEMKEKSKDVLGTVNQYNKYLLTLSNAFALRGVLGNPIMNSLKKELPIAIVKGAAVNTFRNPKVFGHFIKNAVMDSFAEGAEEAMQFGIDESTKKYYNKRLEDRGRVSSFVDFIHGSTSEEALQEALVGMLSGGSITTGRSAYQVITKGKAKSWQEALIGYDNASTQKAVDYINRQAVALQDVFKNAKTATFSDDISLERNRKAIEESGFELMLGLFESGHGDKIQLILDDIVKDTDVDQIKQMYGSVTDSITGNKVETLNDPQVKVFFQNEIKQYKDKAKAFASDLYYIGELFDTPFTYSAIENLSQNVPFGESIFLRGDKKTVIKADIVKKKAMNQFSRDLVHETVRKLYGFREHEKDFETGLTTLNDYISENPDSLLNEIIEIEESIKNSDGSNPLTLLDYITSSDKGDRELLDNIEGKIKMLEGTLSIAKNTPSSPLDALGDDERDQKALDKLKALKEKLIKNGSILTTIVSEMTSKMGLTDSNLQSEDKLFQRMKGLTLISALNNLQYYKKSLGTLAIFKEGIKDESYRLAYITRLFEIQEKFYKEKDEAKKNTKAASNIIGIQPSSKGRDSLKEYSISNGKIWFTEQGKTPQQVGTVPDWTKLSDHIKSRYPIDPVVQKELDDFKTQVNDEITKAKKKAKDDIDKLEAEKETLKLDVTKDVVESILEEVRNKTYIPKIGTVIRNKKGVVARITKISNSKVFLGSRSVDISTLKKGLLDGNYEIVLKSDFVPTDQNYVDAAIDIATRIDEIETEIVKKQEAVVDIVEKGKEAIAEKEATIPDSKILAEMLKDFSIFVSEYNSASTTTVFTTDESLNEVFGNLADVHKNYISALKKLNLAEVECT